MNDSIPKLDKKGLRQFGAIAGAIFAVLFGLVIPWMRSHALPIWPWFVAGVLWVWALVAPMTLDPVYKIWMRFGLVLGAINTRILLGIVFYVLVMPMGLIMRFVLKTDPMARKCDFNIKSYRVRSKTRSRESMEKPF